MNMRKLVKISNLIALAAVACLSYWVFAFILATVFGLKVFRENLSEMFVFSIFGIIAVMAGALIVNIMLNLTRIAERDDKCEAVKPQRPMKKWLYAALAVFPLLAALLFGGNYLTVQKKQQILMKSAARVQSEYGSQAAKIADYRFDLAYLKQTSADLELMEKRDSAFRSVSVIVPDTIGGASVYLAFHSNAAAHIPDDVTTGTAAADSIAYRHDGKNRSIRKAEYIYQAGLHEREYLDSVFGSNLDTSRFESHDGNYTLFYPYRQNGRTVAVFRFADYQPYGKFGS
ncbi:Uncharacterised protein [Bergeriella denitrificans]|uniref:Uncharacterized protein n=2 Tax=Bergeriella denitrificans TaxID=494 RepID=A0A378UJM7_BERDE|nr:Uncharacterised protein [Bergeriella denitrificans]